MKIFAILTREEFWINKDIFNLVPLNEEDIWNDENIYILVLLNGEEFWNDENFQCCPAKWRRISKIWKVCPFHPAKWKRILFKIYQSHTNKQWRNSKWWNIFNLVPLNGKGFWNDKNIFNLVPLNVEGFWNDEKCSILSCKTEKNFKNLPISSHKMEKNFKII